MRIYINEIKVKDDGIYCFSEDPTDGLEEVGQMLVDSDNYGFAYLLDDGESYSYLIFKRHGHCYMKIEIRRLSSITI